MGVKEKALTAASSIASGDFLRMVTSAGAARKIDYSKLAKAIVEEYNGSTIAGSEQTLKAALDSLNSNTIEALGLNINHMCANHVHILTFKQSEVENEQIISGLEAFPSEMIWTVMQDMTNSSSIRVGIDSNGKLYLRSTAGSVVNSAKIAGEIAYMS